MNILKQFIVACMVLFFGSFATLMVASPAYAATPPTPTEEACKAISSGADCKSSKGLDFGGLIKTLIKVFAAIIGIAAVIMIMVSGFKYITASGDSAKVTSAKNTIIYAIIGLIIAALAQVIVRYVIDTST